MSYQEKKTMASIISGVLVLAAYIIYVLTKYQEGIIDLNSDLRFWAATMLIFIGVAVVISVVIQIIFHTINAAVNEIKRQEQDHTTIEDEMDKLIALKSARRSYILVSVGFVISLVAIVVHKSPIVMLNIIYVGFHLGSLFEGISQIYFYRRGIRNG